MRCLLVRTEINVMKRMTVLHTHKVIYTTKEQPKENLFKSLQSQLIFFSLSDVISFE